MADELVLLMAITLLAVGIALSYLPVEECPECLHCRAERDRRRLEEERQREDDRAVAHRLYHEFVGKDDNCPFCK